MKDIAFKLKGLVAAALLAIPATFAACLPAPAQEEALIAAVVNDHSISTVDLAHRTNLVLFATSLPRTQQAAQRLQPQVLKTMIDEILQLQEAEANNVKPSQREIDAILANMERENNLPPGGLGSFLASKGIEEIALERQVRVSLSWSKLVERKFASQATVGEDEINDALNRIEENQGKPRNLVSEIFLTVDDAAQDEQIKQGALRIMQQLRSGASFDALARAFSQNAAAAAGGDLGWLVQGQLDDQIEQYLAGMQPGQLGGPFRSLDGYHIIALRDRRLAGGSSPNQVTVDLRQINIPLSPQATEEETRVVLEVTEQIRTGIGDCDSLAAATLPGGARATNIGRVRIGDLAAPLQPPLMGLQANQMSQPLRGPNGVMLLMVCEREAQSASLPGRDQIKERLFREKLDLLARRYLRDLRRAAFLDIRR
ncbi:MAG: peptidylprolyl isomerase [Proteobacteria bacterium]|nr:peptidylprolyl isomerase [Pseudomonadota bacterium]